MAGPTENSSPRPEPLAAEPTAYAPTAAEQLARSQRLGGVVTPFLTAIFAFLMGGLVVGITGHNPWRVYKAIFSGAGLNWFFQFGNYHIDIPFTNHHVWFWWNTSVTSNAAYNLQQTLILTTTLILTGLAVAFTFRAGLFNIGGQGQYIAGVITGLWVGTQFAGMPHVLHVLFAVVVAAGAGALFAGFAGFLKATVGAHEVITTIMLNWIAFWIGSWALGQGGPLQNSTNKSLSVSNDVVPSAKLWTIWGDPALQAVHVGFIIALLALVAFSLTLRRTTLGYEVRAVGYNPEAARYAGISVGKNYVVAMAIAGGFAGLAGGLDILGYQYRYAVIDVKTSQVGFIGIAVALLGRNKAVGIGIAALLFASLLYGTQSINSDVFPPTLAGNLAWLIQALVLLFIGADVLILYLWNTRRRLGRRLAAPRGAEGSA